MNEVDREMMVRDYDRASNEAQNTFEHSIIRLQDAAYAMGLERGKQNINKTLLVLEQTIKAIDDQMAGNGSRREQVGGIEAAYEQLEALHKELSC
jgi:hypothetical protein